MFELLGIIAVKMRSMQMAESKLRETQYFLDRLHDLKGDPREFKYNLSAFVTAWRSVFDVLLYDYAEKYFNTNREQEKVTPDAFVLAAKSVKDTMPDAERFIEWYNKKWSILARERLWNLRVLSVHRGGPPVNVVTGPSAVINVGDAGYSMGPGPSMVLTDVMSVTAQLPKVYIGELTTHEYVDMCNKGYALMKEMVEEGREKFK